MGAHTYQLNININKNKVISLRAIGKTDSLCLLSDPSESIVYYLYLSVTELHPESGSFHSQQFS